jgi:hypothetical protein
MPFISSVRGSYGAQGRSSRVSAINYFGTGADGAAVISTNTNLTVLNKSGSYDGDMLVRNYSSLTINSGATLTTDQPCRGMLIYVDGNCTINGSLSMTARGPAANPTVSGASDANAVSANGLQIPFRTLSGNATLAASSALFNGAGTAARAAIASHTSISGNGTIVTLTRQGAGGGGGGSSGYRQRPGSNGTNGSTGQTGGGGGGSGGYSDNSGFGGIGGSGSYGSCFGGGAGGAGGHYENQNGGSASIWGGKGGNASVNSQSYQGTGGNGNPGGDGGGGWQGQSARGPAGKNGTGGLIILVVKGNLTIGAGATIEAKGLKADDNGAGSGGSSGGGNVVIAYKGIYTNNGTVSADGGSFVTGNDENVSLSARQGSAGGNGSVQTLAIL